MNRAYSVIEIKAVNEDARIIEGIATTPTPDRIGDIVEPKGAKFSLPLPLLWQHDKSQPVGHVTTAKPTAKGIPFTAKFVKVDEPGRLKDRLDEAWQTIKAGLVRAVSIGFKPIEYSIMDEGGLRFVEWEWLELSLVTIPANQDCTITTIRSIDTELRAASGHEQAADRREASPGASGSPKQVKMKGTAMKTIAEQIASFEATRQAKAARMEELMNAVAEKGETLDAEQSEEYDGLETEVKSIDAHLKRLRDLEKAKAATAKPVEKVDTVEKGAEARGTGVVVRQQKNVEPGIRFARVVKCMGLARLSMQSPLTIAEALYKHDEAVVEVFKANVAAGSITGSTWGSQLVGDETNVFTDFVDFLRAKTILGRFGTNGIPALRNAIFRTPLISQTAGGSGHWVGEGKPIPLTKQAFGRTTLEPLKVAAITPITVDLLRRSAPAAEVLIRDDLAKALATRLDLDFVDPTNSGSSDVKPASITDGLSPVTSSGNDADAVREDLAQLFAAFDGVEQPLDDGVFLMGSAVSRRLSLMRNALGQKEFPEMMVNGGTLEGIPVLTSNNVSSDSDGNHVILLNASDIWLGDEGGVQVDMSDQASLQMVDNPSGHDVITPAPEELVSLWQNDAVAFRAKRVISWKKRRSTAVQYLSAVHWGEAEATA